MDDLATVVRDGIRRRHERLRELADPDCKRGCHGFGYAVCNYIGPGKVGELTCPCTGAAPYQRPELADG